MRQTVNVNRPTPTKGVSGGQKDTFNTVYSALPCSIQPITASWQILYSQRQIETSHTILFNSNPSLLIGDQLIGTSATYLVVGIRDLITLQRVLAVDCMVIQ